MTQTSTPSRFAPLMSALDSLLAATGAVRNFRAIALMGLTLLAAILVTAVFSLLAKATGGMAIGAVGGLLSLLVVFYGICAVGILLMREAQGLPAPSIVEAVLLSLYSSHRLIAVAILELLIVIAALVVIAVVFFICKVPGLGPVLFAVAFPLAAVLLGGLVFSLFYVIFPLAGPAVWLGGTAFQVLARLNMVARTRLISVVMQQFLLFLIVMFAAMIIFAIVGLGFMMATGLSASVIGAGASMGMDGMASLMYGGGAGGYVAAGSIGGGFLFAVAAVIPALIATKGLCIIYLNVTQGLDFSQAETELASGMAAVKKKAGEARERAGQLAERQAQNMRGTAAPTTDMPAVVTSAAAAPSAIAPLVCQMCNAPVVADDAFCGECGHKLK